MINPRTFGWLASGLLILSVLTPSRAQAQFIGGFGGGFNNAGGRGFNNFGGGFNQFGNGFNNFGGGFNQFGNGFNQFGNGFNQFGGGFNNLGGGFNQFGGGFNNNFAGLNGGGWANGVVGFNNNPTMGFASGLPGMVPQSLGAPMTRNNVGNVMGAIENSVLRGRNSAVRRRR